MRARIEVHPGSVRMVLHAPTRKRLEWAVAEVRRVVSEQVGGLAELEADTRPMWVGVRRWWVHRVTLMAPDLEALPEVLAGELETRGFAVSLLRDPGKMQFIGG